MKSFIVGGETVNIAVKGRGKSMAGRKRKVSKATLDALRRGREKLAKMRGKKSPAKKRKRKSVSRKVRAARPLSKQGVAVATRKRTRRKSRRVPGLAGVSRKRRSRRVHGLAGAAPRRRRSSRRRGLMMGGSGSGLKGIKQNIMPVALGIAGAGAAAFAIGKLPATMNPMIRAGIPMAAGLGAATFLKNPMLRAVGMGMAIIGGYALARQALPNVVPALSGIDEMADASEISMGELTDLSGETLSLEGPDSMDGEMDGEDTDLGGEMDFAGFSDSAM